MTQGQSPLLTASIIASTFNATQLDETQPTACERALVSAWCALAGQPVSETERAHALAVVAWMLKHKVGDDLDIDLCA